MGTSCQSTTGPAPGARTHPGGASWIDTPEPGRPFDARSTGLTAGDGAIAFVIGRSSDAGKHYGTIRGIGLSSDGRGQHLTAPKPEGQLLACRRAYAETGVDRISIGTLTKDIRATDFSMRLKELQ